MAKINKGKESEILTYYHMVIDSVLICCVCSVLVFGKLTFDQYGTQILWNH